MTNNALIGAALGWGAQIHETYFGPEYFYNTSQHWINQNPSISWDALIKSTHNDFSKSLSYSERLNIIEKFSGELATKVNEAIKADKRPIVIGGDHATAIGTFSGVTSALDLSQQFGLLWFDAHLDSHTPETSHSLAIHGMPLATLLGYGADELVNCHYNGPKIHPSHVVLIGVRSYESEELSLLSNLGVKIYFIEDVQKEGLETIITKAVSYLEERTNSFGLTIDLDVLDPVDAPGIGSPEESGIRAAELLEYLPKINHPLLKAIEIAEYNPKLDVDDKTCHIIQAIIQQLI